jgi:hypothetical protein
MRTRSVPRPKHAQSMRLTDETLRLMRLLALRNGTSQTAVVEQAVRRFARAEGVPVEGDVE